jgi:hypothetical protein
MLLYRCASSAAAERARQAHRKLGLAVVVATHVHSMLATSRALGFDGWTA